MLDSKKGCFDVFGVLFCGLLTKGLLQRLRKSKGRGLDCVVNSISC